MLPRIGASERSIIRENFLEPQASVAKLVNELGNIIPGRDCGSLPPNTTTPKLRSLRVTVAATRNATVSSTEEAFVRLGRIIVPIRMPTQFYA